MTKQEVINRLHDMAETSVQKREEFGITDGVNQEFITLVQAISMLEG